MISQFSTLDITALVWFFACIIGYGVITHRGALSQRGLLSAVQKQRIRWIEMMAERELRMMDMQLMAILSNANTFFASTSVIVIGGLAAALASGDVLKTTFESLPFIVKTSELAWRSKWILLIGLFIYAFFKFTWAYRLSHYTAIMIGATPTGGSEGSSQRDLHVQHTAALAGNSAENFNAGLQTYYFAIAAAAWLFHPAFFILMTSAVLVILIRREFWSNALDVISGK